MLPLVNLAQILAFVGLEEDTDKVKTILVVSKEWTRATKMAPMNIQLEFITRKTSCHFLKYFPGTTNFQFTTANGRLLESEWKIVVNTVVRNFHNLRNFEIIGQANMIYTVERLFMDALKMIQTSNRNLGTMLIIKRPKSFYDTSVVPLVKTSQFL
jgi:hypothetical protein